MAKRKRKKKKAAAKATSRKGNCPECGGTPRGRGFAHSAGCSKATRAPGGRRGRPKGKGKLGIDIDSMSLEELHSLHQRITKKVKAMKALLDQFKV